MPDPSDPTPVSVKPRGEIFVLVDKNGKALPAQRGFRNEQAANAEAKRINDTWARAKADRKARGAPEITEGKQRHAKPVKQRPFDRAQRSS